MKEDFLRHTIGLNEYITGNRFIDICEQSIGATFCKTDFLGSFTDLSFKVFITHNSDYHIDENVFKHGPQHNYWLMQNKDIEGSNLISIPIGLENMRLRKEGQAQNGLFSSQITGAMEKAILIDKIASHDIPKQKLVYMNFNVQTYPTRQQIWNLFEEKEWVTKTKDLSTQQLYHDIAAHKFIISPRGNGTDCHRTWEALYLHTIPIVKRSTHMNEFTDLPIYFIDKWEDLCYVELEEYYNNIKDTLFDLSKMKISWWRQFVNEKLSE